MNSSSVTNPQTRRTYQIAFRETMKRLHGEIERMVYAAEIACQGAHAENAWCPIGSDCPFHAAHKRNRPYGCMVMGVRDVLGDHFEQHDCMRECPR
jgi:hypothetical protein